MPKSKPKRKGHEGHKGPKGHKAPGLAQFQAAVAGLIMRPMGPGDTLAEDSRTPAAHWVKPNSRLKSHERLQIYNQQYWWRLLGCFSEDFPGLRAVLGERRFQRLAVEYLEKCGSRSWSLRDLGQDLPGFLQKHPVPIQPALALEMARVEWAAIVAFDGPALPALDPAVLTGKDPTKVRLNLQPYVTLLKLAFPVDTLLARLRKPRAETGTASNAVGAQTARRRIRLIAKPCKEPVYLAVHRVDNSVYYKRLEAGAYRTLCAIRDGLPLAQACGRAFGKRPPADAAHQIQAWFGTWTRLAWLAQP